MKASNVIQFLKELAYACLVTWAVVQAIGCSGMVMSERVAYVAITGGK